MGGRTGPMGCQFGWSDRRRASPRWPVHPFVHPEAPSRTDVRHSRQGLQQLRRGTGTTTSLMTPRSRNRRGSRFCRGSNGATPPLSRGRGALAKAQKGEDRSDDHDQTYYVDDGVHGPSPKHASGERETSAKRRVSACRGRRGGRDCRAGRRGDGGGLLCRRGWPWLLDPLGSKRAGRRGGEQANQNGYAHGGSLPSRCTAKRQRAAVAAKPRP